MRLERIRIENFGRLHDLTLAFPDDLTVLMQGNGWGKSTLAAFVKVMFYGFANEKKRGDALERERVRYKPWQGGVYGGELQFEAGGKHYLLNRTFGTKESEDTFALYDAATNLESSDFGRDDTRDIGEELFRINQESFLRTVFLSQNDCVTGTTDSINAKIGNLADNLDDINNYEKVQQTLKDIKNKMAPGRKTGLLRQLKEQMEELKNELRRQEPLEKSLEELEEKLADCRLERARIETRMEDLKKEWAQANRYQEMLATREHYERILRGRDEKQAAVEAAIKEFGGHAPDKERLREAMRQRSAWIKQETERQANELGEEERRELSVYRERFRESVPEDELFSKGKELFEAMEELQSQESENSLSKEDLQELAMLGERLGSAALSVDQIDHMLDRWNKRTEKMGSLGTKRATLTSLRALEDGAQNREKKMGRKPVLFLSVCLVAAGAALCLWRPVDAPTAWAGGIVLSAAGLVLLAASMFLSAGGRKKKTQEAETLSGVWILEQEIAEDEAVIEKATQEVSAFLRGFGVECSREDQAVRDVLYGLKDDLRRLQRLNARKADYEQKRYKERLFGLQTQFRALLAPYYTEQELQAKRGYELLLDLEKQKKDHQRLEAKEQRFLQAEKQCGALLSFVRDFLAAHGCGQEEDMDERLEYLVRRLSVYEADLQELAELEKERLAFEASHDVADMTQATTETPRKVSEIEEEQRALDEKLEEIKAAIRSYLTQTDDRQAEVEELEILAERLAELDEQYRRESAYYHHVELVSDYLARAKEIFSAKYMGPIMDAYRKYYGMMTGDAGEEFRMDANIRMTRRAEGEQRDLRAFSAGQQDLMGIALRMALIDAMYRKEKPFLIFDDSFTNLDDEKLERAKAFLHKVAEEYQVIYFTCSGSRAEQIEMSYEKS